MGLGNILMGDEGIGVRSIEYMQDIIFPENVNCWMEAPGAFTSYLFSRNMTVLLLSMPP